MPTPDPRVAVVIATRNRADLLPRTLDRHRELPERPRVVVVDNASDDGTPAALRSGYPDVEVLALSRNRGAAGRNVGVRHVRIPFVAFSDDDSWWAPGALSRAADLFDTRPRLALVAARILVGPEQKLDPTCGVMAVSPVPAEPGLPGPAVLGFLACGAVVRREAFLEVGGFSERFGVGGEEELLAIDLAARGWELAYVEDVIAHHHPPPRPDNAARRRVVLRNGLWCAWMRRRFRGALRRTVQLLRAGLHDPAGRAGFLDALAGLPAVLRERRPVPARLESALRRID